MIGWTLLHSSRRKVRVFANIAACIYWLISNAAENNMSVVTFVCAYKKKKTNGSPTDCDTHSEGDTFGKILSAYW